MGKCPICQSITATFFAKKMDFTYYRCQNCHSAFLSEFPSEKKTNAFYQKNFRYNANINEKEMRRRANHILDKLLRLNPLAKTILDIGSGYGFFLEESKKRGIDALGIEPSDYLFNESKKKGLTVSHQNLKEFIKTNKNKKYDLVTLIHVIEHVNNPKQLLSQLAKLLLPGGFLYVETPNMNSFLFEFEKNNYTFLLVPDHLWLFSKKSFQFLLPTPLKIIDSFTYSYPEHLMGIIKSIFNLKDEKSTSFENNPDPGSKSIGLTRKLKYLFFDKFLAVSFYRLLNIGGQGSILELYIGKN